LHLDGRVGQTVARLLGFMTNDWIEFLGSILGDLLWFFGEPCGLDLEIGSFKRDNGILQVFLFQRILQVLHFSRDLKQASSRHDRSNYLSLPSH
jgi:hypothetical protein